MFKFLYRVLVYSLLLTLFINSATAAFDPTSELKAIADDGATEDKFGWSVSIDGQRMAVGAYGTDINGNTDQGAVYIYDFDGTNWNQTTKLTASDGTTYAWFGYAVSLSGDRLAVGAREASVGSNNQQGATYIFDLSGGSWSETIKLTADDGAAVDNFGWSVSLSGDRLAVGAVYADINGGISQGAAYVFDLDSGSWTQTQKLTAADGASADRFGNSVSLSGDRLAVGSYYDNTRQGAAYVFDLSGGTWSETIKLTASDGTDRDNFGVSVSLSGDRLAVGSWSADIGSNSDQGAVYVFDLNAGTWTETVKLTASDGADGDWFGTSVSLFGDRLAVGADWADVGNNLDQGAVYVFDISGGTWSETIKLISSDGADSDNFAHSVSLSASRLAVGSFQTDVGSTSDQGMVYVYTDTATYTIGGTISGLNGTIVLQNNGGDDLTINADGPFTFPTGLLDGEAYNITILNPPAGQSCTISNGSGTVSGSNIGNIQIACRATVIAPVPATNAYGILLMLLAMLSVARFGVRRS